MSRESTEELRQRLLRDQRVQELISRRAYEIYVMRGGQPGGEAHDWFQAESEILSILIEEESRSTARPTGSDVPRASQSEDEVGSASPVAESLGVPETVERLEQPQGLTAEERAESQSALGAWSPAEPASAERAPTIGDAGENQTGASATKKAGSRATTKSAAPRKSKSSDEKSASVKDPAASKTSAKRTAPKKPHETSAKTTRSRKKSSGPKVSEE
jgi:hypothetical protein